jgi:hypothetical protein
MKRFIPHLGLLLIFSLFAVACNPRADLFKETVKSISPTITQQMAATETPAGEIAKGITQPTVTLKPEPANPADIPGYRKLIPFDGIRPVYNPQFATIDEVATLMFDEELVMGVAGDGEAKAYPVTVLRFREMVNDELAGIPILVTW